MAQLQFLPPLSEQQLANAGEALGDDNRSEQREPVNRRLHRFYESLVFLSVLEPTRGSQECQSLSDSTSDGFHITWRKFLDHLSWLCDYDLGGISVSSIAAERTPAGPIFWLATNGNSARNSQAHLRWVLEQLDSLYEASETTTERIKDEIASRSISFSTNKVGNYSRLLDIKLSQMTITVDDKTPASGM